MSGAGIASVQQQQSNKRRKHSKPVRISSDGRTRLWRPSWPLSSTRIGTRPAKRRKKAASSPAQQQRPVSSKTGSLKRSTGSDWRCFRWYWRFRRCYSCPPRRTTTPKCCRPRRTLDWGPASVTSGWTLPPEYVMLMPAQIVADEAGSRVGASGFVQHLNSDHSVPPESRALDVQ